MQRDTNEEMCLHTRFTARARGGPGRVAVTCGAQELTYATLDARADQLAGYLQELGVGPEVRVAVCLDRGLEIVVALLAVLKAGGAYVPLDPVHPAERLRFYLADAGPAVLITRADLAPAAPPAIRRVDLERDAAAIDACPAGRSPATTPSSLAYVIYTSGSTGKPKGVEVTHRNVARLFTATAPHFDFGPDDVWSMCHSPAFDFSVWELFGALLHGGRVVVVPTAVVREPREFAALLAREQVTMLSQTPSAFRQLMPALLACETALRCVVFGGEALDPAALRPWLARHGDERPRLVNMYGITETTVHATYRRISAADVETPRGSVLGRPLADLEIVLLDPQQRPVAAGEVGEIYVLGPGVARGYLGRPALTAERFVDLDGRRAYRSGDLAYALPDGELVYLGRADQQIKIRGHRVEPAEVQALLLASPGVADAAVVGHRAGDEAELHAYVVPAPGWQLAGPPLRAALARQLPAYMVPSAVVVLGRLPLTAHGKLDVAALPAAGSGRPMHRPPGSPIEAAVCRGIARALGLAEVGLDDRFVALGGSSLRAAQVARELESELGLVVSVGALLADANVEQLAATLVDAARPEPARRRTGEASSIQLGLWLHAQRYPEDVAYNETIAVHVPGPVEVPALTAGLAALAARHPALRAGLVWRGEGLDQDIADAVVMPLAVHDLAAVPADERASAALQLAEAAARVPFDLARPPLVRALLVRLAAQDHRIYLVVHHAICDAQSLGNLAVELAAHHDAALRGQALELPPLPVVDTTGVASLVGGAAVTRLPVDFADETDDRTAARESFAVPPALVTALRAVGAAERATMFAVLLATWHALLHRHGCDETRVGVVAAQRTRDAELAAVGPLFSVVPSLARPRGERLFTELLAEVRTPLLAALDRVVAPAAVGFETGFGLLPRPPTLADGWVAHLLEVSNGVAKHDLLVLLQEDDDGGLRGCIEYRAALRRPATVARLAGHFVELLHGVAAGPQQRLSALEMLTPGERAALAAWSCGPAADADDRPVHTRFLHHARRSPSATAVMWSGGTLSYADLATRAAGIAARLQVGPDQLVAVALERSPDLVAALLGVLMAGGAVLPLDPLQPAGRLAQLLADARPACLLTTSSRRASFPGIACVCIDDPPAALTLEVAVEPGNLAYVVHTSGSTGRPKGVQIEHRSLASLASVFRAEFTLGPADRVLQFAPITFDVGLMEVLCTLAAGAALVLPDTTRPLVGAELLDVLRERAITLAALPASLLATLPADDLPALTTMISGGEACPPELVDRWARGRRFVNAYGPTEATVGATLARCEPGQGKPPIGRPRAGVEVHVLDSAGRPVPIGVPGELHLGGPCLARGYLHQPAATAASFIPHPDRAGDRLYRTGDRVRWREDGQLDFLGRVDRQLKLRGFRVEPAEIEAVLLEDPAVQAAVVVAHEAVPGHSTLVAYVATQGHDTAHLRAFLRTRLPAYMVPSTIVRVDELPLTAHGKVDLTRLPAPPAPDASPELVATDSLEARIVAVWREVLGVGRIGHDDSFFDLGGTSLLLVRVHARLAAVLGRVLTLAVLFERTTPRALAELLRGEPGGDPTSEAAARASRQRRAIAGRRRPDRSDEHG